MIKLMLQPLFVGINCHLMISDISITQYRLLFIVPEHPV